MLEATRDAAALTRCCSALNPLSAHSSASQKAPRNSGARDVESHLIFVRPRAERLELCRSQSPVVSATVEHETRHNMRTRKPSTERIKAFLEQQKDLRDDKTVSRTRRDLGELDAPNREAERPGSRHEELAQAEQVSVAKPQAIAGTRLRRCR